MRRRLIDIGAWAGIASLWIVVMNLGLDPGLGLGTAKAQTSPPQIARSPGNKAAVVTSGSGPYYFEFRSRQAWDYGHTFVVFGRVGEAPSRNNVAGLSPKGDDPSMWVMGHYVPVPSDTGWTDGDLEDRYITSRYRVLVSKEQYDRTVAYIRQLQAKSTTWSAELYNCNAFVADIAKFMGLREQYAQDQHRASGSRRRAHQRERKRDEQSDARWPRHDRQRHVASRRRSGERAANRATGGIGHDRHRSCVKPRGQSGQRIRTSGPLSERT
jgi:hypothetical protein